MEKNNNTLLLVGGGVAAWYLLSRYSTIKNLLFVPRGIAVVGGAISVILGVQNPTSNSLAFQALSGSLVVNGNNVGNVASFQPLIILPNAETQIQLLITPNLLGIGSGILNLIEGNPGSSSFSASLQATANINNTAVPVNVSFT